MPKIYYTIRLWLNEAMIYHLKQGTRPVLISGSRLITPFIVFPCYSSVRQLNRGGSINYREEEKKILDQILDSEVYDNRIRPAGTNGTGESHKQVKQVLDTSRRNGLAKRIEK